ncbi:hypothetical protein [Pontibacter beigongshangensis]|uniref:hypothetical protein n=1 Tax=Pontibacter beigongshangensis TaxID=2574733 RepID=UPI00164F26EE|nr:hypothetical protein [Pontibacter beigongshangensis]
MSNTSMTNRTAAGENFAAQALSKAVVYFIDGNSRKFFSRDKTRKQNIPNRTLGMSRLKKMVEGWHDNVQTAIIYDNTTDQEVTRYKDGSWT